MSRKATIFIHLDAFTDILSSNGMNVTAQFTPKLSAYVTTEYQKNQIIRGQIQGGIDWEGEECLDLTDPEIHLNWTLEERWGFQAQEG